MKEAIYVLQRIRTVLGTLSIISTRSNLDILLGCMQLCDQGIEALNKEIATIEASQIDVNDKGDE
jgi:hypothetical protein